MNPCSRLALCLLAAASLARLRADPLAEVSAAYQSLHDEQSYAWETMEGNPGGVNTPGMFKTPYGLARGSVTVERVVPHVQGMKRSDGSTVIAAETPRDSGTTAIIPPSGRGVALTPAGWMTREELQPLVEAAVKRGSSSRDALQIASAALATKRPDLELPALIHDVKIFNRVGDEIVGELSPAAAEWIFGPTPSHLLVHDLTASISFQITDGMIRSYTLRTEATVVIRNVLPPLGGRRPGEGRIDDSPPMEEKHATTTIINHAPSTVPAIPEGATRKLAQLQPAVDPAH